jgi:hypothetical protein
MLSGDNLAVFLFWIALSVPFGIEAVKAEERTYQFSFAALAAVTFLLGLFWVPISKLWPPLTEAVASVATSPQSWFLIFMFAVAVFAFGGGRNTPTTKKWGWFGRQWPTSHDVSKMVPPPVDLRPISSAIDEIRTKLDDVEKNVIRNNVKLHNQDIETLLDTVINSLEDSLLFNAVRPTPDFPVHISDLTPITMGSQKHDAEAWVDATRLALTQTVWRQNIQEVLSMADGKAEAYIRSLSQSERPKDIDPLDLRLYGIARQRCENLEAFIQEKRREAIDRYKHGISRTWDQLQVIRSNNNKR